MAFQISVSDKLETGVKWEASLYSDDPDYWLPCRILGSQGWAAGGQQLIMVSVVEFGKRRTVVVPRRNVRVVFGKGGK